MKYLMGLILSFTLGISAFAQDTKQSETEVNQCVQACLDKQGDASLDQQNLDEQDKSNLSKEPCPEGKEGADVQRYENGSVYYHEDPELRESFDEGQVDADFNMDTVETTGEADARVEQDQAEMDAEIDAEADMESDAEMEGEVNAETETDVEIEEQESTDVTKEIREGAKDVGETIGEGAEEAGEAVVEGAEEVGEETKDLFTDDEKEAAMTSAQGPDANLSPSGGLWRMKNQCSLHKELENRTGTFKIKKDLGNAELKVEREKDGEENLQYESDTEVYTYERNENGKTEYYYSISKDNEMIEYMKDKDGVTDVIYHGVFNSPEEANQFLQEGVEFEGFSSVCSE